MLELTDKAFIIAEAGTCHTSPDPKDRFEKAKRYVFAARDAGADCVKFQMFDNTDLFCRHRGDEQRRFRWDESEIGYGGWCLIKEITEGCGMMFLASVFQHSMVEMLSKLNVEATKVASRAAKNFPYKDAPKPLLISFGMATIEDIKPPHWDRIELECESVYPSTRAWSGEHDGFSDHSGTPWRAIDAISRGCKLVEVHFYINPMDAGPDLPASLNLDQLKLVCEARDAFNELRSDE